MRKLTAMPQKSKSSKKDAYEAPTKVEGFDTPLNLSLRGNWVTTSGKFEFGTLAEVFAATRAAGGLGDITDRVGPKTDIIVIGSKRSPHWKFGDLGIRWADALKRRQVSKKPLIIDEPDWYRALPDAVKSRRSLRRP